MRSYLKQRVESKRSTNEVWEFLKSNKDLIDQQLRKSFFSRMGGFRVKLNRGKSQLTICRLNPMWDYTVVKITPNIKGSVLEIKSVPQPFYDYIFLGILTVLLSIVAYSTKEILFLLIVYLCLLSIGAINLNTKYRNFLILVNFCKNTLASE